MEGVETGVVLHGQNSALKADVDVGGGRQKHGCIVAGAAYKAAKPGVPKKVAGKGRRPWGPQVQDGYAAVNDPGQSPRTGS